jgi:hypothetical protein
MRISLFESPLPEEDAASQLVVFELCVPTAFGIWRDITYHIARNHSVPKRQNDPAPPVVLDGYTFLKDHFISPYGKQRITIASTAKSFMQSHYRNQSNQSFPCDESSIIKNHPLRYRLWDRLAREWLPSAFPVIEIRPSCTPDLPDPYNSLKWTTIGTTTAPNEVIAQQLLCPRELSYHEWENFGHLRAGVRLQWRNILLQLISGGVDLANPAVHLVVQQAAWQAETALEGNFWGHYREAHFDLSQEDFGIQIVDVLGKLLASIAGNWKEGWTAATRAVVACRIFSLTPYESVKHRALSFLSQLRQKLFAWLEQVLALVNKVPGPELPSAPRVDLVDRIIQLAASCRQTYAVGFTGLQDLFCDRATMTMFIRCAIILHTNVPPNISSLPSALRYLLERDVLISVETLDLLRGAIARNGAGLDDAILGTWQGFRRGSAPWWMVGERWIACLTSAESSNTQVRSVHLNLQSGCLLVDGQAQGTLPKEIAGHSFFQILFPNRVRHDELFVVLISIDLQFCSRTGI